ncbi:hypothetical protein [Amycolatopsis plumensis]|uniref:Uncharacterized protein n=1 Tax=Amycolatopsis plumensis TaxID=236508 RepID=A0ABV5UGM4_9PSEU
MSTARHAPDRDPRQPAQQPHAERRPAISRTLHAPARDPRRVVRQRHAMSSAPRAELARNPRQTTPSTARHHFLIGGPR